MPQRVNPAELLDLGLVLRAAIRMCGPVAGHRPAGELTGE